MATFKVGDRVRKVRPAFFGNNGIPVGSTGTIVHVGHGATCCEWSVCYDCQPDYTCGANREWIAPLTDPNSEWADQQIQKLLDVCKTEKLPLDVTAFGD